MNEKNLEQEPRDQKEQVIEKSIGFFNKDRFNYVDDIPEEFITAQKPDYKKYKCRTNWWDRVFSDLHWLTSHYPEGEIVNEARSFIEYIKTIDFTYGKRREPKEIAEANKRLDQLLELLHNTKTS